MTGLQASESANVVSESHTSENHYSTARTGTQSLALQPLFRYPGSKNKIRDQIVRRLCNAMTAATGYCEPFLGGASICRALLNEVGTPRLVFPGERASRSLNGVWINDKDIGIACLWNAVIRYPAELCAMVKKFTPTVREFKASKKELLTLYTMPTAASEIVNTALMKLVVHQLSYSGLGVAGGPLGGLNPKSPYTIASRWSPGFLQQKIWAHSELLNGMPVSQRCCTSLDFEQVCNELPRKTLLYLDPPYFVQGNTLYQHGMYFGDHDRLAAVLKRRSGLWILSYDDCPEIRELYRGTRYLSLDNVNYSVSGLQERKASITFEGETAEPIFGRVGSIKSELLIVSDQAAEILGIEAIL